jgi:hypothetical protein
VGSAAKALLALRKDEFSGSVRILHHLVVPQPKHDPAMALKIRRSPSVIFDSLGVLTPV